MPDAQVIVTELDGLTVHTLMGPEEVLAVTSHVLETSGHLVVIDTQLTTTHSAQLRALCDRLNKPIAHLILSHGHPDHYFGLTAFRDVPAAALPEIRRYIGKRFKGHQAMHKTMEGALIPDDIVQPTLDLEPGELVVDGIVINVERVRGGEDVEQALFWLPGQNAVIAQDLVSNGYHAFFGTGPLDVWLATLDRIAASSPQVVFAGHGPPGGKDVLSSTGDYLKSAFAMAQSATSKTELITAVMDAYPERKGRFLVEVSALIVFRDRARAER